MAPICAKIKDSCSIYARLAFLTAVVLEVRMRRSVAGRIILGEIIGEGTTIPLRASTGPE